MGEPEMMTTEEWNDKPTGSNDGRDCTCHPDDRPAGPCPKRFAASECQITALRAQVAGLETALVGMAQSVQLSHDTGVKMMAERDAEKFRAEAAEAEIARLRAELDAARGRVKPMVWREVHDGNHRKGEVFGTRSPVSFAPITAHKKHDGWWLNADCKTYPNLEAAKSAAQADYTARILAALEPDPTIVRMREAVTQYHLALDRRENGNSAGYRLQDEIQRILNMPWKQGAALAALQEE